MGTRGEATSRTANAIPTEPTARSEAFVDIAFIDPAPRSLLPAPRL